MRRNTLITKEERRRAKDRLQQTYSKEARAQELRQSHAVTVEQMEEYEAKHLGGFKKIYPRKEGEKYDKYFKHSRSLFQETTASKAREECARQQLQELQVKQEQKERYQKGGSRKDLQGETAGERAKPRRAAAQPAGDQQTLGPSPPPPPQAEAQSLSVDPQAAEVPQEEAEEPPEEDDREERERVQALIQRKKMLEDLEVVDLIQKLLQSQKKGGGGGGVPEGSEEACSQQKDQRREQAKLDSLTSHPQRPQQQQPCPQILLKQLPSILPQQCLLRPAISRKNLSDSLMHLNPESLRRPREKCSSIGLLQKPSWPVSSSLVVKQDRRNSSCADVGSRHSHPSMSKVAKQGVCCPYKAAALESLVIISTPAPVVSRPAFSHAVRNTSRRALQQSKGL
ncbi:hypothetical protein OJAV_G00193710 [Oryzias javanicus]|uniref:Uncharacterized protein n=1 Tax=Oryzias javanicus TaxID=123683 RepID=A0A3S2NYT7_ORYJA|nr:hypothetical protein OJAV_G00193710 [Oryzias javanicus]